MMPKSGAFVKMRAHPGQRNALEAIVDGFVDRARTFPGCEAFAYFLLPEEPDTILLLEFYSDEEARVAQLLGKAREESMSKMREILAGPPEPTVGWLIRGWGVGKG